MHLIFGSVNVSTSSAMRKIIEKFETSARHELVVVVQEQASRQFAKMWSSVQWPWLIIVHRNCIFQQPLCTVFSLKICIFILTNCHWTNNSYQQIVHSNENSRIGSLNNEKGIMSLWTKSSSRIMIIFTSKTIWFNKSTNGWLGEDTSQTYHSLVCIAV